MKRELFEINYNQESLDIFSDPCTQTIREEIPKSKRLINIENLQKKKIYKVTF